MEANWGLQSDPTAWLRLFSIGRLWVDQHKSGVDQEKECILYPFAATTIKRSFFEHGRERVKGLITETVPFHHRAEAFGFVCLPIFDSYGHANNWLLSPPKRYHDPFCDPWWFFIVQPGGTSNSLKATTTSQLMLDTTEIILNHETWPPSF